MNKKLNHIDSNIENNIMNNLCEFLNAYVDYVFQDKRQFEMHPL